MQDVTIEFWTYDMATRKKERFAELLVHAAGGFEVISGHLSRRFENELRTRPLRVPPTTVDDYLHPRMVLPKDGIEWARAVLWDNRGIDFWAEMKEGAPDRQASAP